jgi:Lactonase, 7-bladed beta-propeller
MTLGHGDRRDCHRPDLSGPSIDAVGISGRYLIASGEKSDRLSVYRIDQASGKLGEPTRYPVGKGANWIEIVEVK